VLSFDGERDHVHLLVYYPPKVAGSKFVNGLKGASSRVSHRMHPDLQQRYWNGVLRSPCYFAGSCGWAPLDIIRAYIEQQQTPKN
jgi:putative transposase